MSRIHQDTKICDHLSNKTFIWETRNRLLYFIRDFIFVHAVIMNLNTHGVYSGGNKERWGRKVSRNALVLLHRGRVNTLSSLDNSALNINQIFDQSCIIFIIFPNSFRQASALVPNACVSQTFDQSVGIGYDRMSV